LLLVAFAAAEPHAGLLPPFAAAPYVPRASSEEIPADLPPPSPNRRREPISQYPPTYSSGKTTREYPQMAGIWKRITSVFEADDKTPVINPPKEGPTPVEMKQRMVRQDPRSQKEIPMHPQNGPLAPNATQIQSTHVAAAAPAWMWYGYGAPVPGSNSLAPTGRYNVVQPSWYTQTGATPGAIPKMGGVMQGPALSTSHAPQNPPAPQQIQRHPPVQPLKDTEGPEELIIPTDVPAAPNRSRQADLDIPISGPRLDSGKPARIDYPVKQQVSRQHSSVTPSAWHASDYKSRAQAPEAALVPSAVIAALKTACTGHVARIDVLPKGPRQIGLRLTLIPGILADRLADRIAKLPELEGWEVEMQFGR
jgi:hypothetical protein